MSRFLSEGIQNGVESDGGKKKRKEFINIKKLWDCTVLYWKGNLDDDQMNKKMINFLLLASQFPTLASDSILTRQIVWKRRKNNQKTERNDNRQFNFYSAGTWYNSRNGSFMAEREKHWRHRRSINSAVVGRSDEVEEGGELRCTNAHSFTNCCTTKEREKEKKKRFGVSSLVNQ